MLQRVCISKQSSHHLSHLIMISYAVMAGQWCCIVLVSALISEDSIISFMCAMMYAAHITTQWSLRMCALMLIMLHGMVVSGIWTKKTAYTYVSVVSLLSWCGCSQTHDPNPTLEIHSWDGLDTFLELVAWIVVAAASAFVILLIVVVGVREVSSVLSKAECPRELLGDAKKQSRDTPPPSPCMPHRDKD